MRNDPPSKEHSAEHHVGQESKRQRSFLRRRADGARWRARQLEDRLSRAINLYRVDRKYGIDTRRIDVTHKGDENQGYMGTNPKHFAESLRKLPSDRATYTFVDLGCGKGTALVLASEAGFRRVVGVELIPELLEAARRNVTAFEARHPVRSGRIELVQQDAATYDLPREPTVLFLFNPFSTETLRTVVTKVRAALATQPHTFYLLYMYMPDVANEILTGDGALELVHSAPTWSMYRSMRSFTTEEARTH